MVVGRVIGSAAAVVVVVYFRKTTAQSEVQIAQQITPVLTSAKLNLTSASAG
ncbi:MAG TPA: hypothetical protein VIE86_04610 [Nitrososphaera sp.]|jgi:hypothetical protein